MDWTRIRHLVLSTSDVQAGCRLWRHCLRYGDLEGAVIAAVALWGPFRVDRAPDELSPTHADGWTLLPMAAQPFIRALNAAVLRVTMRGFAYAEAADALCACLDRADIVAHHHPDDPRSPQQLLAVSGLTPHKPLARLELLAEYRERR